MSDVPPQPINAPSGMPYGQRQALEQAQRQMPLADNRSRAMEAAQRVAPPQGIFGQADPDTSELPTAGLRSGPGPGPEALATQVGPPIEDDMLMVMAKWLPLFEMRAATSTMAFRNMVRRLRATLPPEVDGAALAERLSRNL